MKLVENIVVTKSPWYFGKECEKWILVGLDALALLATFYLTAVITSLFKAQAITGIFPAPMLQSDYQRVEGQFALILLSIIAFWTKGHYWKRRPFWNELREVLKIFLIIGLVESALVLFAEWPLSRADILLKWLLAPGLLLISRGLAKHTLTAMGGWVRPMVIIGTGNNLLETAKAFEDEALMGYRLIAFLVPEGKAKPEINYKDNGGRSIPLISLPRKLQATLTQLGNPHVVLALEQGEINARPELVQQLSDLDQDMQIVPSLRGLPLYGMEVNHFFSHEILVLTVRNNLARRAPRILKRSFDIAASLSLLIIGSPLLLWIAVKVAASGRPIFYGHKRIGQNGKSFPCYKFRTMQTNAAELLKELLERDPAAKAEWERDFKLKNDPRVTPIGHFLRKTSLDELPQLWNVLKGEMSLVGPRPVVDAELERYGNQVDLYLKAKPGITGLWQISGRNDISYDSRVYLDGWYVKNWSWFHDIVILIRTVKVILKRDGAY
ncbi:undecaprenyl-phosphate galactose phosphotransferase WbaP [Noviherbaspirillum sedimenti]|uniref:Undecaprenyl-phosphate galactose phosphotransferase WbaP n=1 Tax=Noviherbaspirillum sedimenti TaxID=2320865 RepID=A0A3A3G0S4_9BURK|nr:undecaprenyl-phosphate galactose phosphotransferase WbaP [Noviherbaspirillum sedimenti]RJG02033.1 undecaprenyl-phosphate galactose phosphotransferase WbaP [Noviherbaspirillum sedimenti]